MRRFLMTAAVILCPFTAAAAFPFPAPDDPVGELAQCFSRVQNALYPTTDPWSLSVAPRVDAALAQVVERANAETWENGAEFADLFYPSPGPQRRYFNQRELTEWRRQDWMRTCVLLYHHNITFDNVD